jgi:hypothetical protein
VDARRDRSADTPAGAAAVVSSADADEQDRRAKRSLIIALFLALLVAAAVGFTNANGATDLTSTGSTSTGSTDSSTGEGAPSGACRISDEVAAALSAAETPWDYMRVLGYPKHTIGDALNERAESVMDEHANGQVRWDPSANDGVYSDDAQLVLIMGEGGQTVEITDTQHVMGMFGMEAICPPGTSEAVLPAVS